LAQAAVDAILAQSMSQRVPGALGDHFAQVLDHLPGPLDAETTELGQALADVATIGILLGPGVTAAR
jgi:hypothetical protein